MTDPIKKGFPRALPFRSPEEIAVETERWQEAMQDRIDDLTAQAGRMRRWTLILVLALTGTVAVAVVLVYRNYAGVTPAPAPPIPPAPQAKAPVAPAAPAPPVAPAAPTPPAPQTSAPAAEPLPKDLALETMGGLSAASLYQSYLTINLLADGVAGKAFSREGALDTLRTVTGCLSLVETKLARLDVAALELADRASLKQIQALTALLKVQARALEASWTNGTIEPSAAFQRARQASGTALGKVLGIKR